MFYWDNEFLKSSTEDRDMSFSIIPTQRWISKTPTYLENVLISLYSSHWTSSVDQYSHVCERICRTINRLVVRPFWRWWVITEPVPVWNSESLVFEMPITRNTWRTVGEILWCVCYLLKPCSKLSVMLLCQARNSIFAPWGQQDRLLHWNGQPWAAAVSDGNSSYNYFERN